MKGVLISYELINLIELYFFIKNVMYKRLIWAMFIGLIV